MGPLCGEVTASQAARQRSSIPYTFTTYGSPAHSQTNPRTDFTGGWPAAWRSWFSTSRTAALVTWTREGDKTFTLRN